MITLKCIIIRLMNNRREDNNLLVVFCKCQYTLNLWAPELFSLILAHSVYKM